MSHNRENLRLSLLDLQATLTAPSQTVAAALLPQAPAHMQQLPSGSSSNISNSSSNTHSHSSSNISACGSSSNINTGVSQAVSMATTTVARLSKAGFGAVAGSGGGAGSGYQNDKCDRLKKMTSITCSDSEDDSERRAQFEISSKWNLGGYEGVSLVATNPNYLLAKCQSMNHINLICTVYFLQDTRTYVVQEIYRNEQSYVESLQTVVVKYLKVLKAPEHAGMIDTRTVDEIFFMVPDILEIHEKFLSDLKSRLDDWDVQQKVGDAFMDTVKSI